MRNPLRRRPPAGTLTFPTALDTADDLMDRLQTSHGRRALATKRRAEALTNARRAR